ncbi:MAG: A24 family peptidase [Phycisphaerales bacterium]|nr:A24 family peptidase [Phycisphaerales bacterium]
MLSFSTILTLGLGLSPDAMIFIAQVIMPALFLFAFGACVGSLTNVLVYRMPLGLSVVTPPSRCPACETQLTWRENIPIFGWLLLRGRCRFCKSKISPEYPLVELFIALVFVAAFVVVYVIPDKAVWLDLPVGTIKPTWARGYGAGALTWPLFTILLCLLSCLIAMTIVDAKTFTIPMGMSLTPAYYGLFAHTAFAAYFEFVARPGAKALTNVAEGWVWAIPTPTSWWWLGASLGGGVGVLVSLLMLRLGLLSRSFEDFETWDDERRLKAEQAERTEKSEETTPGSSKPLPDQSNGALSVAVDNSRAQPGPVPEPQASNPPILRDLVVVLVAAVSAATVGVLVAQSLNQPRWLGGVIGLFAGLFVGAGVLRGLDFKRTTVQALTPTNQAEEWTEYPHARREMVKELAFLGPIAMLGWLGGFVADRIGNGASGAANLDAVPLTVHVLAGCVLGYLVGGGVVWLVRIFGSLLFGREAMGMGDVHLMAGVGVCVGWINTTVAFFVAAFVGLVWTLWSVVRRGGAASAMPYGPFLAVATVLVLLGGRVIERVLSQLLPGHGPILLP